MNIQVNRIFFRKQVQWGTVMFMIGKIQEKFKHKLKRKIPPVSKTII